MEYTMLGFIILLYDRLGISKWGAPLFRNVENYQKKFATLTTCFVASAYCDFSKLTN